MIALVVGAATVVLGFVLAVSEFPRGLGLLACVAIAGAGAWYGALRRGIARVAGRPRSRSPGQSPSSWPVDRSPRHSQSPGS